MNLGPVVPALLKETDDLSMMDFTYPHCVIFGRLLEMHFREMPIDFIRFTQFLHDKGQIEECGGAPYLAKLYTFLPSANNYPVYARTLREINRALLDKVE